MDIDPAIFRSWGAKLVQVCSFKVQMQVSNIMTKGMNGIESKFDSQKIDRLKASQVKIWDTRSDPGSPALVFPLPS